MAFAKANAFFFFLGCRFGFFFGGGVFSGGGLPKCGFFFSEGGEGQRRRPAIGQLFFFQGGARLGGGKVSSSRFLIGFWKGSTNRIFFFQKGRQ